MTSRSINGVAQSLVRDALGRIRSVTNALGAFTYQYDGVSRRLSEVDGPNGRKTVFAYFDALNDLRLQQIKNLAPDGSVLSQFDYLFDAGGRVSTWSRQLGSQSDQYGFEYDPLGQVTRATQTSGGNTLSQSGYSYDDAGNRISTQIGTALTRTLSDDTNAPVSTQGGGPVRFAGQLSKPAAVTVNGAAATVDSRNRFEAKVNLDPGPQTVPVIATDFGPGTWLTRGPVGSIPYDSVANGASRLQIPNAVDSVVKAKNVWWRYIAGPRPATAHPEFGVGGGAEYRVGGF